MPTWLPGKQGFVTSLHLRAEEQPATTAPTMPALSEVFEDWPAHSAAIEVTLTLSIRIRPVGNSWPNHAGLGSMDRCSLFRSLGPYLLRKDQDGRCQQVLWGSNSYSSSRLTSSLDLDGYVFESCSPRLRASCSATVPSGIETR